MQLLLKYEYSHPTFALSLPIVASKLVKSFLSCLISKTKQTNLPTSFYLNICKKQNIDISQLHLLERASPTSVLSLTIIMMKPSVIAEPYNWPHDGTFSPQTTALVIIDMQMDCKYLSTPRLSV